jgi:hypothetical protein
MANGNGAWTSRKYRTGWYLTTLSTLVLIAPFVSGFFMKGACTEIIDGAQWLTFLAVLWGAYFGANVAEKHMVFQSKDSKVEIVTSDPEPDPLKDGE